jgi:L-2-hydroxyglutarate oxidase LhgO
MAMNESGKQACSFIIIGGGIAGVSCAEMLTQTMPDEEVGTVGLFF